MQQGSIIRAQRKIGPNVWEFRWREPGPDGRGKHRRMVIGRIDQLVDESAARGRIAGLHLDINFWDARPEFAAAVKKSLELRGDGGTGWSTVWRVALWARLQSSEHAYNNLKILINTSPLPNMFDLCPPFQIDGNLGGPAAITEMLVQSTTDGITVLPSLPQQWPSGSLKGVSVRGGGKVDIAWKEGRLTELKLQSDHSVKYR